MNYRGLKLEMLLTYIVLVNVITALLIVLQTFLANFYLGCNSLLLAIEAMPPYLILTMCAVSALISVRLSIDILICYFSKVRRKSVKQIHEIITDELLKQSFFHRRGI